MTTIINDLKEMHDTSTAEFLWDLGAEVDERDYPVLLCTDYIIIIGSGSG